MKTLKTGAMVLILSIGGTTAARDIDTGHVTSLQVNRCAKGDIAWN